jgi:hypothetical protein
VVTPDVAYGYARHWSEAKLLYQLTKPRLPPIIAGQSM